MAFTSAEDRVDDDHLEAILEVLVSPSPWQEYLAPALDIARPRLPKHGFRVQPRAEFTQTMHDLGHKGEVGNIPGVTNKRTGVISMLGWFGEKSRQSYLGAALHETVHLVSHDPGRSTSQHSTAWGLLGEGILEGLVEAITCDVLNARKIKLAKPSMRGHQRRVPVVRELMKGFTIPILGRVLFQGNMDQFRLTVTFIYGGLGWHEVRQLTTNDQPEAAIMAMKRHRAAEEKASNARLQQQIDRLQPRSAPPAPGP